MHRAIFANDAAAADANSASYLAVEFEFRGHELRGCPDRDVRADPVSVADFHVTVDDRERTDDVPGAEAYFSPDDCGGMNRVAGSDGLHAGPVRSFPSPPCGTRGASFCSPRREEALNASA